jgi:hypothetical protein
MPSKIQGNSAESEVSVSPYVPMPDADGFAT